MSIQPSSTQSYSSFDEFWQEYIRQHQHPMNPALHVLGTVGGLISLGLTCYASWKWVLAFLPVGYGLAWIGHFVIEKNRPLTFTYPLWSLRADYRMVAMLLMGRRLSLDSVDAKARRAA